ncbi:hypothetical protein ACSBR2_039021 [Camellia fascicularis]
MSKVPKPTPYIISKKFDSLSLFFYCRVVFLISISLSETLDRRDGQSQGQASFGQDYHLTKEHGYRSCAAWKHIQLESKFSFLRSSCAILDLYAAPGGWMQVSVERVPVGSLIIDVNLIHIRAPFAVLSASKKTSLSHSAEPPSSSL